MAYTSADLTAIDAAILALASGERVAQVSVDGHTVSYSAATLGELRALRSEVASAVSATGTAARRRYAFQASKGL